MIITHIEHSCFLMELSDRYFLFDYFKGELPELKPEKPMYAFASHKHADHFSMELFYVCQKQIKTVYILSNDIHISENYLKKHGLNHNIKQDIIAAAPNCEINIDDMEIVTLKSTDQGVAFSIRIKDKHIYHAGDLNWWYWEGESESYNEKMEQHFKSYLQKIEGEHFDIAFLPLDSRQGEQYCLGFDYFMKHTDTKVAFPMHFWDDNSVITKLKHREEAEKYRECIVDVTKRNSWEI